MKKDQAGNYHVTFEGKEFLITLRPLKSGRRVWYLRFEKGRKSFLRSLDTSVLATAEANAMPKIKAIVRGDKESDERLKLKSDVATLGEIFACYEKAPLDERGRDNNVNSLKNLLRTALGVKNPEAQKATVLTADLVHKFAEAREALIGSEFKRYEKSTPRVLTAYSVRTSTRAFVVHARALFARDRMPLYRDLKLPDLSGFKNAPVKAPDRRKPRALDAGVIEAINQAAPALAKSDPGAYVAHLLFKFLGMRNAEIRAARWDWLERNPGDTQMAILDRPEEGFAAKGNEGRVPVAADVLAELQRFKDQGTDGFIVPGANKTERADAVDRRHSQWVGQWIKDRSKTSYELRRYAGSMILDNGGTIEDVRDFLRHAEIKTTLDWYAYRLRKLKPLTMAQFAPKEK